MFFLKSYKYSCNKTVLYYDCVEETLNLAMSGQVMNTSIGVEIHYTQAFIMLAVEYSNNIYKKYFPTCDQTNQLQYNYAPLSKSSGLSHFC